MKWSESLFEVNDQDVKGELFKISGEFSTAIKALTEARVRHLRAEATLARTKAVCDTQLRAEMEQSPVRMTDDRVKAQLPLVPAVQRALDEELEAHIAKVEAQGLCDAYARRQSTLMSLSGLTRAELTTLQYTT